MYANQWIIISIVFIILLASYYIGFFLGKKYKTKNEGRAMLVSDIQAGLMGILGIMMAFSFSLASERFEQRRKLIIEESVNIGTAYFRAGLLPDTLKKEIRDLLKLYVNERIEYYKSGNTTEDMQHIQARSEQLQVAIWAKTAIIGKNSPNLNTNINILSLNAMIDVSGNVSSYFHSHVPKSILILLTFITTCTVLIIGYGHGLVLDRNLPFIIILNFILCSILLLIIDFDTPTSGFLQADIYSMIQLKNEILTYDK